MLLINFRKVFNVSSYQILLVTVTVHSRSCVTENLLEFDPGAVIQQTFIKHLFNVNTGSDSCPHVIHGSVGAAQSNKQYKKSFASGVL